MGGMKMPTGVQWWQDLTKGLEDDPVYWAEAIANRLAIEIKKQLDARGLSQKDLANRLGVSSSYVSQILNGQSNMTLMTLCKLAHALDLEPKIEMKPKVQTEVGAFVDAAWGALLEDSRRHYVHSVTAYVTEIPTATPLCYVALAETLTRANRPSVSTQDIGVYPQEQSKELKRQTA
jgi:transcriptional regulator with XRE-family HTH domain